MRIKIDDLTTKGDDSESLLYFTGDGDDCFTMSITDIYQIVKNAQYSLMSQNTCSKFLIIHKPSPTE